ncbi:hypothetical protein [Azoarcus taiwanensis]|uniref:Uncharacterized protein n=1 Tax=Azoarcus taiwanensis TaxID=666964 RepID=A0A972J7K9_9RHOO|nr:hypothetical protein [Azoarcus taiwanensis]NMG01821.1 hypothetical protein [Azoarcus taiwanensis]
MNILLTFDVEIWRNGIEFHRSLNASRTVSVIATTIRHGEQVLRRLH